MPKPRIHKNMAPRYRKLRAGMSDEHLRLIRQLDCILCYMPAGGIWGMHMTAHHLLRTGEHGIGRKSADKWAVPAHFTCHEELHAHGDEDEFLAMRGIDGRALAKALWAATGDLEAMQRIIFRAIQEARLKLVGAERIELS